jgi:hypothetical protein
MVSAAGTFVEHFAALKPAIFPSLQFWTPLGPQPTANTQFYGNVSGRVTALAVDPCDATGNTVYAGGADGGFPPALSRWLQSHAKCSMATRRAI